jgi:hypothetical protein
MRGPAVGGATPVARGRTLFTRQQFAWLKWFGNIVVRTGLEPDYTVHGIGGGGYHDDSDSRTFLAQPSRYRETIFVWQTDIEQHERWTIALHELPKGGATANAVQQFRPLLDQLVGAAGRFGIACIAVSRRRLS